jgi:hypothetical protein
MLSMMSITQFPINTIIILPKVIGPDGLLGLGHTSRLLVTHRLQFLRQTHQILLIENGRIVERGTFGQLQSLAGGKFAEMMADGKLAQNEEEEEEMKKEEEAKVATMENGEETRKSALEIESDKMKETKTNGPNVEVPQKANKKLIEKERIETGRVKMGVYLQYVKAAGMALSILFVAIILSYQGFYRDYQLTRPNDSNFVRYSNYSKFLALRMGR